MIKTMNLPKIVGGALALAFLAGGASPAAAQVADHLKCYRVRDPISSVKYSADLVGLAAQPGCTVRARGKYLCAPSSKTNVSPTPPGGGPNVPSAAHKFNCYRIKCPKQTLPSVNISDQFGTRTVFPRGTQTLCAQASPSGAFLDDSSPF